MIENNVYEVKQPILWFRMVGHTSPDGVLDFPEQGMPVYESILAAPGDRFRLIENQIVHEAVDGMLSRGVFRLNGHGNNENDIYEAMRLQVAGDIGLGNSDQPTPMLPQMPATVFTSCHSGIIRRDFSPAFCALMDATEALRHDCDADGSWIICCGDYGESRTVSLSFLDVETHLSILQIEYDPMAGSFSVTTGDNEFAPALADALREAGLVVGRDGKLGGNTSAADTWSAAQNALAGVFLGRTSALPMAMSMSM